MSPMPGSVPPEPRGPRKAQPCRCHEGPRILAGDDRCNRCGHYPKEQVTTTWEQMREETRRQRRRQKQKRGRVPGMGRRD